MTLMLYASFDLHGTVINTMKTLHYSKNILRKVLEMKIEWAYPEVLRL